MSPFGIPRRLHIRRVAWCAAELHLPEQKLASIFIDLGNSAAHQTHHRSGLATKVAADLAAFLALSLQAAEQ